jgi:hypothetical protein
MPPSGHERCVLLLYYVLRRAWGQSLSSSSRKWVTDDNDSGVFDTPKVKCPPDRGSSDCVRDSLASPAYAHHSLSPSSSYFPPTSKSPTTNLPVAHKTSSIPISSGPRSIPLPRNRIDHNLSTPPLTPDGGSDCSSSSSDSDCSTIPDEEDALDFLMTIFPQNGLKALPYARRVAISAPNLGADFDGVVLELPGKLKTLYVDGKRAAAVSLRER